MSKKLVEQRIVLKMTFRGPFSTPREGAFWKSVSLGRKNEGFNFEAGMKGLLGLWLRSVSDVPTQPDALPAHCGICERHTTKTLQAA